MSQPPPPASPGDRGYSAFPGSGPDQPRPQQPGAPGPQQGGQQFGQPGQQQGGRYAQPPNAQPPNAQPPNAEFPNAQLPNAPGQGPSRPGQPGPYQPGPYQTGPYQPGPQMPHQPGQPVPARAYPVAGQQGAAPTQQNRPVSRKLLMGLGIGTLALILVTVGGLVVKQQLDRQAAEKAAAAHAAEKDRRAGAAGSAVDQYFAALGSGSASQVLGLLSNAPDDGVLLDDKSLTDARKVAAIEGVQLAPANVDDSLASAQVAATYQVGGKAQSYQFTLSTRGDGWAIDNGLGSLELASDGPIVINGQKVDGGSSQPAFLGGYAISTGTDRTQYENNKIIVGTPEVNAWNESPTLTDKGNKYIIDQAKQALDKCASSKEIAPKGCPFEVRVRAGSSQQLDRDSIRWTITNDPLSDVEVMYTPDSALIRAPVNWRFSASGTCDGRSCSFVSDGNPTVTYRIEEVSGKSRGAWLPF